MTLNKQQIPLPVTDPSDQAGAWLALKTLLESHIGREPVCRPEPLAALIPFYLEAIEPRTNDRTRRGYASYLRTFAAHFGNSAAGQIDPALVEMHASKQGWSDTNRANYLWIVQAFVRWAGRKDFNLHRPARESRGADAVITEETQRLILKETRGDFHELCRLLWSTGCRPMEAARLQVGDVDFASGTVTLKRHKTKHKGKRRIIYLSTEAASILRGQVERYKDGPLFRDIRGGAFSLHAVVCRMIRVSEKIGRSVTAYGYRHGFCTRALAAGIPDAHLAALMGHTSTRMIHEHYSHIAQNARLLRETAEKISTGKA